MIDLLIVLVAYAIGSGLCARHAASQNLQEYFLAGKTIPGWKAGFSMAATQFAADTPLLVTGLVATAGIFALWRLWIYALAFLLMAFVFAVGWRRGGVLSVRVILGREDGYHLVQLEPEGAGLDFGRAPERARGLRPLAYDVLEHISERLWHVGGHLEVEPDRRHAQRIIMRTAIETVGAPSRVEPAALGQAAE